MKDAYFRPTGLFGKLASAAIDLLMRRRLGPAH